MVLIVVVGEYENVYGVRSGKMRGLLSLERMRESVKPPSVAVLIGLLIPKLGLCIEQDIPQYLTMLIISNKYLP